MNITNKIIKSMGLVLALFTVSCESYLDVNENPNNPEDAPISGLMINVTMESSRNVYRTGDITSNLVQYIASPNPGSASDTMEPVSHNVTWFNLFNVMTDLTVLMEKAEEQGATHYLGASQILFAFNLGMAVDMFGDLPITEGFTFETATPAYDDDAALYAMVMDYLDQGISNLGQATSVTIGTDDFIYGGDTAKWVAFANTLKARNLLHMGGSATEILQAVDNGFQSNGDNALVNYFTNDRNPWYNVALNNSNLLLAGWISEQFVQALDGTSYPTVDPRLALMIGATDDDTYVGTENGAGRGNAPEAGARSTLIMDQYYTTADGPLLMATYAELKFIEAEAAFATNKARSYQAYLDGITAHMEMLEVDPAEMAAYLAEPSVSMGEAAFTIDDIFKEKWIALFLHPESWNDARRYDYQYVNMTLPANLTPDLNGQFVRRMPYPDNEVSRNGANVPQVTLLDRIFWDAN